MFSSNVLVYKINVQDGHSYLLTSDLKVPLSMHSKTCAGDFAHHIISTAAAIIFNCFASLIIYEHCKLSDGIFPRFMWQAWSARSRSRLWFLLLLVYDQRSRGIAQQVQPCQLSQTTLHAHPGIVACQYIDVGAVREEGTKHQFYWEDLAGILQVLPSKKWVCKLICSSAGHIVLSQRRLDQDRCTSLGIFCSLHKKTICWCWHQKKDGGEASDCYILLWSYPWTALWCSTFSL